MTVTKDSVIGDVLDQNIETAQFFFEIGMHCLFCAMADEESIEVTTTMSDKKKVVDWVMK